MSSGKDVAQSHHGRTHLRYARISQTVPCDSFLCGTDDLPCIVRLDMSRQTCSDWNRYHVYHAVYGDRLVRIMYSLDRPPTNSPPSLRP